MSYAIPIVNRIYSSFFLCLCFAVLLVSSVANASTLRPDIQTMLNEVSREMSNNVNRPSGSTISTAPTAPTVTKNPSGGLSASTQNSIRTSGYPSTFSSTSNYSLDSAKNALKTCVRSPACAGRALGAGAVIYEGINAWKDVYNLTLGNDGSVSDLSGPPEPPSGDEKKVYVPPYNGTVSYSEIHYARPQTFADGGCDDVSGYIMVACEPRETSGYQFYGCPTYRNGMPLVGYLEPNRRCQYGVADKPVSNGTPKQLTDTELDNLIEEGYEPSVSDAPIVISGSPQTITLSTPASVQLPSTTTTSTDSNGVTTTSVVIEVLDYTVINNGSSNPSIESSIQRVTNTYDASGNQTATKTETTNNPAVSPTPVPAPAPSPTPSTPIDFELPPFCSWATIICDFIAWVKEPLDEPEVEFTDLIVDQDDVIEEYEFDFSSPAQCPEPIILNLPVINKTVEIKYDPLCSYVLMINPIVITAAWILAAFIYLGVLRRG